MYKHSTTHRTLSRRLAALLAAMALLAALALPVYAEALNGAAQMQETVEMDNNGEPDNNGEADNNDETGSDVEEGNKSKTNEGTGKGADTDSENTNDNASPNTTGDSNTTADDAANDTPQTLPDDNIDTTAGKTTTNDILDTMDEDEDAKQDIVTRSADGAEESHITQMLAAQTSDSSFKIYFAVPTKFADNKYTGVKLNYQKSNNNWPGMKDMKLLQSRDYLGRKVYEITISPEECPEYFQEVQFHYVDKNGNIVGGDGNFEKLSGPQYRSNIANKLYDAESKTWQDFTPYDLNNHQTFAGKTMLFQNQSDRELTDVKAIFYENDQEVATIDLGAIAVGKRVSFKIPKENCSYICFLIDGNKTTLYSFYGQQNGDTDNSYFLYDSGTACYVYKENDNGSSWTIPQGKITVYFDATFSSAYTENGDTLSIPKKGSKDVYCCFKNDSETTESVQMTPLENNLYSVEVPGGCSEIMFSGDNRTSPANSGASTDWVPIDWSLDEPCYMADTNDAVVYNNNASRGGYWKEKTAIRDAEAGKGTTVVDIDNTTSFVRDSATKYVTTTLYDYYTDWELNGNNRDDYKVNNGASQRNWVTFRQFDQALSDYYSNSGVTVLYPMYTGQFQPEAVGDDGKEWGFRFNEIADKLNLYGYSDKNKFMAVNNSTIDVDGKGLKSDEKKYYDDAFQGLTGDELVNGEPVLYNTKLTVPYFNKDFLEGANSKKAVLGKVYENVDFPFTKEDVFGNGINYWHYESNDKSLFLKQKKETADQYFLQQPATTVVEDKMVSNNAQNVNSSSTPSGTYGFFPFNEGSTDTHANTYNYGFGAKLQFDFTLTDDGQVLGKVPIQFFFSGDDDVWVYIDDKLALDVGGDHGKVSGLLEFGLNSDKKLVYTPYVSDVKASNRDRMYKKESNVKSVNYRVADKQYKQIPFNYKGDQKEISAGKHTLKFFYMERGMWESNMAIAFNFPDHNELQVEKQVDLTNVPDEEFAACFTNQKLFNFTILNQATHYGTTPVESNSVQHVKPIELSSIGYNLGRMDGKPNDSNNYCESANDPDKKNTGQVIHWYAEYDDTHSDYRKERMGVITLNNSVDITGMDYLSFYIYASGQKGEGTLSLSNMYLQLVDSGGKVLGCNDKESLSGTTYNQVDLKNDEWIKIKLDLSRLTKDSKDSKFDMTQLKEIRIGDNYQRDIYFKDFTFTANPTIKKITGFTTEQKEIPDYGSAADGKLKPAISAQFSSSIDGKTRAVDENGQFTLQDKEVVTFSDQFRRGSYLSVTEDADPALFDTTWTIYENGVQVKNMNPGKTVQNADPAPSVVEQPSYTPNDGRTEKTSTDIGLTGDGNSYNGKKPNGEAIVFRSYTNPDAGDAAELTKLKLQFVNKVKTGSLTINKEAAAGEQEQIGNGEYTFTVTFANVGGLGLESKPIVKTVTIKGTNSETISGIPVGTRFHIVETSANNNANVSSVTVSGGKDCKVVNGKEAIGSIVEGNDKVAIATFTNTTRTLIDIGLTKKWVDADNKELPDVNLPRTIYVQLQRKTVDDTQWTEVRYPEGETKDYVEVEREQGGWTHKFANLDATAWNSPETPEYEYRVVEGTLEKKGNSTTFKPVGDDGILIINGNAYKAESTTADKTHTTITLTNTRLNPKFNLDILKKSADEPETPLEGVEFKLEKLTADGEAVDEKFTARIGITNAQGEVKEKGPDGNATEQDIFHDLEAGAYRLTETKAAAGYNLLSAPILVTFGKDETCTLNGSTIEVSTKENKPTEFTKDGNDRYTLALTVLNRKTPALPHTGADAPSLWLLIGLPLAVAGLLILVFRYNKKGGRTR